MRTRVSATVNQDVLTSNESGVLAAQKRAGLAELIGVTKALGGRKFFTRFSQGFDALTGFGSRPRQGVFQAVGVKSAGQKVVDGDIVASQSRGARKTGHKTRQATASTVG